MRRVSVMATLLLYLLLPILCASFSVSPSSSSDANWQGTIRYFAIGSNMLPATMTSLRNLQPLTTPTAAILPGYRLAFPGGAAAAQKENEKDASSVQLHGVLYELNPEDFTALGRSEGVPFGYIWERCKVIPYVGNSDRAGVEALEAASTPAVEAFVLVSSPLFSQGRGIPTPTRPSASYLDILQEGATLFEMDRSFQISLSKVKTRPGGWEGPLLKAAQFLRHTSVTLTSSR